MTCEVCDREGCPRVVPMPDDVREVYERMRRAGRVSTAADSKVIEQHRRRMDDAAGDCGRHAVNWRDEAIAGRVREAALQAEVERLTADDNTAADQFRVAIEEHLPEYALSSNDADLANHVERIEYAGEEIKRLTRDLAAARADAATCRQVATEAIDGWEDQAAMPTDGPATLRARLTSPEPGAERAKET